MSEERKKPKIRFTRPLRRTIKVVLPELLISALMTWLVFLGVFQVNSNGTAAGIALLTLVLYVAAEVFLIRGYRHSVKSPTRYYCTNFLAFGILTLLAAVSAWFNIGSLHTWLFLPFKLFYFPDWMSRIGSALAVGLLLFLIPILYPPVHRFFKKQSKLAKNRPKRRGLRREITHRYHKWQWKRRHKRHRKERQQRKNNEPPA